MLVIKILNIFFVSFIQFISLYIFYGSFGKKTYNNKRIIILSITEIGINVISMLFIKNQILFILIVLGLFFYYSFIFKISLLKRVFVVLTINILSSLLEVMFGLIMTLLLKVSIEDTQNNLVLYIQVALLSKMMLLIISIIVSKLIKRNKGKITWWQVCSLCVMPLSSFIIIYTLSSFAYVNTNNDMQVLSVASSIILLISNLFAVFLFYYIGKQAYKESKLVFQSLLFDNEREYYQNLLANEHNINKAIHDLKNELFAIRIMLENSPKDAYEKINKICEIVDENKVIKICMLDSINSLVTNKVNYAKQNGIEVEINSFVGKIDSIDQVDLCMILGNLFDNAIEACNQVNGDKKVYFELKTVNHFLKITMTNPNVIASGCIIGVFATILFVCVVLIITHDVKKSRK